MFGCSGFENSNNMEVFAERELVRGVDEAGYGLLICACEEIL
jgi:hypothetical protein